MTVYKTIYYTNAAAVCYTVKSKFEADIETCRIVYIPDKKKQEKEEKKSTLLCCHVHL